MTSSLERMSLEPGTSCQLTATSCHQQYRSRNELRRVRARMFRARFRHDQHHLYRKLHCYSMYSSIPSGRKAWCCWCGIFVAAGKGPRATREKGGKIILPLLHLGVAWNCANTTIVPRNTSSHEPYGWCGQGGLPPWALPGAGRCKPARCRTPTVADAASRTPEQPCLW